MKAGHKALFLVAFITLALSAFAYEVPLSEFGFAPISNTTNFTRDCKELTLEIPSNTLANEGGAPILSLNSNFYNYSNDTSYVSVSINGSEEEVIWPESFACTESCYARVFLPELMQGQTKVNICAVLGGKTQGIEILEASKIGLYNTPVLTIKNSAPGIVYLGDRAKMTTIVTNEGTKASTIRVQFIHPDTRAAVNITSFDIVEGESYAVTTIYPGETKNFVYYIKPTVLGLYNLPSAAMFFKNVFGENQFMISNHPMMSVQTRKQIEVSLIAVSDSEPRTFKAIIKNNLDQAFSGVITISPQVEIQDAMQEVEVPANSEKEILFKSEALTEGDYEFFATIRDTNNIYSSNKIAVQVENNSISIQMILAIVGIIAGALIFAWIYFLSEGK